MSDLFSVKLLTPNIIHAVNWLKENFESCDGFSVSKNYIYNHYNTYCSEINATPLNTSAFGKLLRSVFINIKSRRLGTRGNSKYHYYGIKIKTNSHLYEKRNEYEDQLSATSLTNFEEIRKENISNGSAKLSGLQSFLGPKPKLILPDFDTSTFLFKENSCSTVSLTQISKFLKIYRLYNERLVDSVYSLDIKQVRALIDTFWSLSLSSNAANRRNYPSLIPNFQSEEICHLTGIPFLNNYITKIDLIVYDLLAHTLIRDVLEPLPAEIIQFAKNLATQIGFWFYNDLTGYNEHFKLSKSKSIEAFRLLLKNYASVNHVAQAVRTIFMDKKKMEEMALDASKIDFESLMVDNFEVMCKNTSHFDEYHMIALMQTFNEFKCNLRNNIGFDNWTSWIKNLYFSYKSKLTTNTSENHDLKTSSMALPSLLLLIMNELTLESVSSFGSFHILKSFVEIYIKHLTEESTSMINGKTVVEVKFEISETLYAISKHTKENVIGSNHASNLFNPSNLCDKYKGTPCVLLPPKVAIPCTSNNVENLLLKLNVSFKPTTMNDNCNKSLNAINRTNPKQTTQDDLAQIYLQSIQNAGPTNIAKSSQSDLYKLLHTSNGMRSHSLDFSEGCGILELFNPLNYDVLRQQQYKNAATLNRKTNVDGTHLGPIMTNDESINSTSNNPIINDITTIDNNQVFMEHADKMIDLIIHNNTEVLLSAQTLPHHPANTNNDGELKANRISCDVDISCSLPYKSKRKTKPPFSNRQRTSKISGSKKMRIDNLLHMNKNSNNFNMHNSNSFVANTQLQMNNNIGIVPRSTISPLEWKKRLSLPCQVFVSNTNNTITGVNNFVNPAHHQTNSNKALECRQVNNNLNLGLSQQPFNSAGPVSSVKMSFDDLFLPDCYSYNNLFSSDELSRLRYLDTLIDDDISVISGFSNTLSMSNLLLGATSNPTNLAQNPTLLNQTLTTHLPPRPNPTSPLTLPLNDEHSQTYIDTANSPQILPVVGLENTNLQDTTTEHTSLFIDEAIKIGANLNNVDKLSPDLDTNQLLECGGKTSLNEMASTLKNMQRIMNGNFLLSNSHNTTNSLGFRERGFDKPTNSLGGTGSLFGSTSSIISLLHGTTNLNNNASTGKIGEMSGHFIDDSYIYYDSLIL